MCKIAVLIRWRMSAVTETRTSGVCMFGPNGKRNPIAMLSQATGVVDAVVVRFVTDDDVRAEIRTRQCAPTPLPYTPRKLTRPTAPRKSRVGPGKIF